MRRIVGTIALATLMLISIFSAAHDHMALIRRALSLRNAPMDERRRVLFSPWYEEVIDVAHQVPDGGTVDLVMLNPGARDIAVLAGPLLQPRDVRYFDGMEDFRARRRARFLHDALASNAIPGPPPPEATITVLVDASATPRFRVMP